MNFQQLEYIVAVAKTGHFGKAATECNITQATLSGMIIKLESELNTQLFDRTHSPIKATEDGKVIIDIAKEILAKKQQMAMTSMQKSNTLQGKLTLAIIPTIACNLLPLILRKINEVHPNLKLTIKEQTTDEIVDELNNDNIDIGILATPLNIDKIHEEILYYEPMMLYGVKEKAKKWVSPEELMNKNIWLLEEGHCFRTQAMTLCEFKEKNIGNSNLIFEANSFDTLINITDQYGGLTLIPELYYLTFDEAKKKKTRNFETPIPVREVSMVCKRPSLYSHAIEQLKTLIQSEVNIKLSTNSYKKIELNILGV